MSSEAMPKCLSSNFIQMYRLLKCSIAPKPCTYGFQKHSNVSPIESIEMEKFMDEAFVEARKALDAGEVPVGCVFVYGGEVIARAGNYVNATKNATKHSEILCIDQVMDYCRQQKLNHEDVFPQISVVVTVEPCIMCSSALHMIGVKEIIFGCCNDRFGGKTVVNVSKVVGKSIPIRGGICAEEAMYLLKEFYKGENPSAPVAKSKR